MSNNLRETKQRFTLRKNKRYKNVVSVGLGLFAITSIGVITSNEAKASDDNKILTTENPATNYPEAQPNPTVNAEESQNQTNKSTGEIEVAVDNSKLNEAVEKAKQEGLNVVQEDTQNKGTVKSVEEAEKIATEINNSYTAQAEEINKETENYKKAKEENQKQKEQIIEENAKIKADYEKEKIKQKEDNDKILEENKKIEAENSKKKAEYDEKLEKYKLEEQKFNEALEEAQRNSNKEGYLKKPIVQNLIYKDEPNASARIISGGLPVSLDTLSRVMYKGRSQEEIDIVNRMLNDENKKYWASHIPSDMITESDRETIPPILSHLTDPPEGYIKNSKSYYAVKFKEGETISVEYTGLENSSYAGKKITKTIQEYTFSGTNNSDRSGMAYFFNNPNGTILATSYLDYSNRASDNKWLQTNGVDEEETFSDGSSYTFTKIKDNPHLQIKIKIRYFDENGQEIQFTENEQAALSISSISSRRYYESTGVSAERAKMNGELVEINGSVIKKQGEWLEGTYSDYREIAVIPYESKGRGLDSNPDGAIYKISGAGIITPGTNPEVTIDTDYSIWFYINSDINSSGVLVPKITPPKEPTYTPLKTLNTSDIPEPKYKEIPEPPKEPTIKYNYYEYTSAPQIEKTVINSDKEDINGKFVNKQAEVSFPLNIKELISNREITNKFEIIDNLPKGYELNIDKTIKLSADYDVTYDKNIHTIIFKAKQNMLDNINKNLTSTYKPTVPVIVGTVLNDGATYLNNFKLLVNDYEIYSNTVKVITPGDNPTPETPDNSFIKPTKENTNKDGVNIDGKTVLPNTVNYYKLLWDLDQYKNIKATTKDINKGFYYVEDYPEEALELDEKGVTLVDSKGEAVTGVKVENFNSIEEAPEEVKTMLENTNIKPKGAFQLFTATNTQEFFEKYVETGNSIIITSPMTVKKAFNGEYENKAYQVDFGNGYETNVVVNNVPQLKAEKEVVNISKENVDNKEIGLNGKFEYNLNGAYLPSNRAEEISQYDFIDDYDEKGDKYLSYKVITGVDVTLKDGRVIEKGTDITTFTEEVKEDGKVTIKLKQAFLNLVSLDSEFKANAILEMERIATGTFENTYINVVNGNEVISNTVKTTTPEPKEPTPEEPKEPEKPTIPVTPEEPVKKLSNTGIEDDYTQEAVGLGMAGLGLLALSRRRKEDK